MSTLKKKATIRVGQDREGPDLASLRHALADLRLQSESQLVTPITQIMTELEMEATTDKSGKTETALVRRLFDLVLRSLEWYRTIATPI